MTTLRITLGSVTSATSKEDLIPALCDALDDIRDQLALPGPTTESVHDNQERRRRVAELDSLLGKVEHHGVKKGYFSSEQAQTDLENLLLALNAFAPAYCSFYALRGHYGFWVDHNAIENDTQEGELRHGPDLPDTHYGEDGGVGELFLHISDHGNMELYQWSGGEWVSLWAVV